MATTHTQHTKITRGKHTHKTDKKNVLIVFVFVLSLRSLHPPFFVQSSSRSSSSKLGA